MNQYELIYLEIIVSYSLKHIEDNDVVHSPSYEF